jgi:hypothetical protein
VLNIENLTKIDPATLRNNIWKRIVYGHSFGKISGGKPKGGDFFQRLDQACMEYIEDAMSGKKHTREKVLEHAEALELSPDRMPDLDEIRKNHRKLALKHHPDRNLGDPEAAKRFERVQKAYDTLSETHEYAEQAVKSQETIISRHLAAHQVNLGLKDVRIGADKSFVTMPVDHLPADQKSALLKAINDHGFSVEERFSNEIGCNVVNVTRKDFGPLNCAELCQKLKSGVDNKKPAVEAVNTSKATAKKVKDAVKDAVKAGDEIAPKANGKAKWIIGGIIVATVAAGAFYAVKKKSLVQQENERRKNNEAHVQGIH